MLSVPYQSPFNRWITELDSLEPFHNSPCRVIHNKMNFFVIIGFALLLILVVPGVLCAAPTLIPVEGKSRYSLSPHVDILEDRDNKFTFKDISSSEFDRKWIFNKKKTINFNFSKSVYWLRFSIKNPLPKSSKYLLEIAHPLHDYLDVYILEGKDKIQKFYTGDRRPFSSRPLEHKNFIFELSFGPDATKTIYLKLKSYDGLHEPIPLILWKPKAFSVSSLQEYLTLGGAYGLVLAMALYNLIIFIFIRDRAYLYYVLYLVFFVLWATTANGISFQFLWPEYFWWTNQMIPIFGCTLLIFAILFTLSFLNLKKNDRRISFIFGKIFIPALILLMLLALSGKYSLTIFIYMSLMVVFVILVLSTAIRLWLGGLRIARYYLLAWIVLLISGIVYSLKIADLLPFHFFTEYAPQVGSALEAMLLSFALADRYQFIRRERNVMKQSLRLASEVQRNLLPGKAPKIPQLDVYGHSIYCDETGGDYYDYFKLPHLGSNCQGVVIGDVSGHGISSALLMAGVRAYLRARSMQPGSIADILTDVNRLVYSDTLETSQFMTVFFLAVSDDVKRISWVRAGHDPALIYSPETDDFSELKGRGIALGVDEDWEYETFSAEVSAGQIMILTSDGIFEAHNAQGEMYGKDRLKEVIRTMRHLRAGELGRKIIDAVSNFRGEVPQEDDITLVIITF